jgi:hypothetical protein
VSDQELAEVHREAPVHEVDEHQVAAAILLDTDRELIGEAPNRPLPARPERDVRVVLGSQIVVAHQTEELPLVIGRAQPPATPVGQNGIENHHALDHPPDNAQPPVSVVGLADRFVQRLVVNVVQPPSPNRSRLDDTDESSARETRHELAAILAAHCAGEGAVLPLQEAAGVDHHGHQELALPLRETKRAEDIDARSGDAVVEVVRRVFVAHRNSSIPRGCGPDRPRPPLDPRT